MGNSLNLFLHLAKWGIIGTATLVGALVVHVWVAMLFANIELEMEEELKSAD
jgi:hypothetical protein